MLLTELGFIAAKGEPFVQHLGRMPDVRRIACAGTRFPLTFLHRGDTLCVHPSFHHERPSIEGDDWTEEGGAGNGVKGGHDALIL